MQREIVGMKQGNVTHPIKNEWNCTSTPLHYRVHNSPSSVSFLSQINPVYILRYKFFELLKVKLSVCLFNPVNSNTKETEREAIYSGSTEKMKKQNLYFGATNSISLLVSADRSAVKMKKLEYRNGGLQQGICRLVLRACCRCRCGTRRV
jgi:hypothetical protein